MIRPGYILLFCFLLRAIYAAYVQIGGIDYTVEGDALAFYSDIVAANRIGQFYPFEIGRNPYINSAVLFTYFFGTSPFSVSLFSAVCFTFAGYLLLKTCLDLRFDNTRTLWAAALFCFWPTAIVYTSTPLRESMQVLGVMLMIFGFVRALTRHSPSYGLVALVGTLVAGSTHGSLAMSGAVSVGLFLLVYSLYGRQQLSFAMVIGSAGIAATLLVAFLGAFSVIAYDLSGGLLESITRYQEGGLAQISRADYRSQALGTSLSAALTGLPLGLLQYLFEPLPGRSFASIDLVLLAENGLRLLLIGLGIRGLLLERGVHARIMIFLLLSIYFVMEMVWSVGTINWGTAARHHVPSMGALVLAALYYRGGTAVSTVARG